MYFNIIFVYMGPKNSTLGLYFVVWFYLKKPRKVWLRQFVWTSGSLEIIYHVEGNNQTLKNLPHMGERL